jgi:hypothetical protein
MQCRRYLCSKLLTMLITLLSVTISPHVGGAQTASSVTEQDITGLIIATQEDRVSVSAGDTVISIRGGCKGSRWGTAMRCSMWVIARRSRVVVSLSIRVPGVSFGCRVT